jgi:hypothetical protein
MIRRFALCSIALAGAVVLGTVAAPAYPAGDPLDTSYTFHVPIALTDVNADKARTPADKVEVICAVSESETAHFSPRDAATGLPTGKNSTETSKMIPLPAAGSLSQTVDIVVKGTAYERSYLCGVRFYLKGIPIGYAPSDLNKPPAAGGPTGGAGMGKGVPGSHPGDLSHPYDDSSLKEVASGLIN